MRPPYNAQNEGGDWHFDDDGTLHVKVIGESLDMPWAFLFALHELIEAILCKQDGVSQAQVDQFDAKWRGDGEPGDAPGAPYRTQHRRAMLIEHQMAWLMGLTDYGRVE